MASSDRGDFIRWHLRLGWIGLFLYLALGVVLEVLHGFKAPWYLHTGHAQRRMLLTLAHTHGTLFSLIQIAVALTSRWLAPTAHPQRVAFWGMTAGQVLVPLGFLIGGIWLQHGEPGLGIFLIPFGAAALLAGTGAFVWSVWSWTSSSETSKAVPSSRNPEPASSPTPTPHEKPGIKGRKR